MSNEVMPTSLEGKLVKWRIGKLAKWNNVFKQETIPPFFHLTNQPIIQSTI